jgi:hypothetical protein
MSIQIKPRWPSLVRRRTANPVGLCPPGFKSLPRRTYFVRILIKSEGTPKRVASSYGKYGWTRKQKEVSIVSPEIQKMNT